MQEGLNEYYTHLKKLNYNLDFIYLTTAAAPVCWDNSPPNIDVAKLITEWNERKKTPLIRYITPNELLERIKQNPIEYYPLYKGDWTDYWNFGCGSTAVQTRISRAAKYKIYKADFLNSYNDMPKEQFKRISKEAWENIHLFDEHTWGSYNSMDPDNDFSKIQFNAKDNFANDAHELAEYLLIDQLEDITINPENYDKQEGILVFNPTGKERTEYLRIPDWWFEEGKRRRTARFGWQNRVEQIENAPQYGPVKLPAYSCSEIKMGSLKKAYKAYSLKSGEIKAQSEGRHLNVLETVVEESVTKFIESEFIRIEFDPANNRITRVFDKTNNWEVLDSESDFTFFQFVRETTDPLFKMGRRAYYARELNKEKFDISCWNTDWKRIYRTAVKPLGYQIIEKQTSIELELTFKVPGSKWFKQKFVLHQNKPGVEIMIEIMKKDIRTPESVYFVTPLNLNKGWECTFDTAGIPLKLDEEQLPGASRDWFTVEKFVAMYNKKKCAVLICPDAPMIQPGDFNFGKRSKKIERNEKPLLIAWALNNYWDTNFRPTQPGYISLRYIFKTYGNFDEQIVCLDAEVETISIEIHPLLKLTKEGTKNLIRTSGKGLKILYIKKSEDDTGLIFRLTNLDKTNYKHYIDLPGKKIKDAFITNTYENILYTLKVDHTKIRFELPYKKIVTLLVR
jgi:hypothetical protein